jgi:hypothetical protein
LVTNQRHAAEFAGQLLPHMERMDWQGSPIQTSIHLILLNLSAWHGFCNVNGETIGLGKQVVSGT